MADIAHITTPDGSTYDLKDATARQLATQSSPGQMSAADKTKLDSLLTGFPNFYVDLETMELVQDGEMESFTFELLDGYLIV